MKPFLIAVVLSIYLVGCTHFSKGSPVAESNELIASINARLSQELKTWQANDSFPGASISYFLPDGRTSQVSIGFADLEASIPMGTQKMLGASTGKMFAAACALKLVEQGKLKLDEPIAKWFARDKWFSRLPNHQYLTLRSLLNHTSGLPNYVEMPEFFKAFQALGASKYLEPQELIIRFVLDKKPAGPVGEKFLYAETNYILMGLAIERVTGRRYYDIAGDLLSGIGLLDTVPSNTRRIENLAAGYVRMPNEFNLPKKVAQDGLLAYHPATEWTGGGFATTSSDLAKWLFTFHQGKVLSKALTDEARTSVAYNGEQNSLMPKIVGYGFGIMIFETQLGTAYGHSGNALGYRTWTQYYPSHNISIALMVNTSNKDQIKPGIKGFLRAAEKIISRSLDQ